MADDWEGKDFTELFPALWDRSELDKDFRRQFFSQMLDHAFEKTCDFLTRKNGSNFEALYGSGANQAGKILSKEPIASDMFTDLFAAVEHGEVVYVKPATYEFASKITCTKNIEFHGSRFGSILKPATALPDTTDMIDFTSAAGNSIIHDLTFEGIDAKPRDAYLLKFCGHFYGRIERIYLYTLGMTYPKGILMYGDGMWLQHSILNGNNQPLLDTDGPLWAEICDNAFCNGNPTIRVPGGGASSKCRISDFYMEAPAGYGIEWLGNYPSFNVEISHGQIWMAQKGGITAKKIDSFTIDDVKMIDCGSETPGTYDGLYLENCTDGVVSNIVSRNRDYPTYQRYGINLGTGCDYVLVGDVNCHGNADANYDIVMTGANSVLGTHIGRHA